MPWQKGTLADAHISLKKQWIVSAFCQLPSVLAL